MLRYMASAEGHRIHWGSCIVGASFTRVLLLVSCSDSWSLTGPRDSFGLLTNSDMPSPASQSHIDRDERAPLLANGSQIKPIASYDGAPRGASSAPAAADDDATRVHQDNDDEEDDDDEDEDDSLPAPTAKQRRRSTLKWSAFWLVVAVVVGVLIWQAYEQGGGQFDWKGALKKAAGGVSIRLQRAQE